MKKLLLIIAAVVAGLMITGHSYAQSVVQGEITANTTWSSDVKLRGPVFVRAGATLTVTAGVKVFGEKASLAALIIDRGAKLVATGTETNPVIFTSDQPEDSRQRADWGGLIINGYSILNVAGGVKEGEGDTGTFGCSGSDCNEADNSGTLQYTRVEYGGIQFSPDNELNGIAFQAVGSGTIVDHVQVAYSKDDGIEFFGGTCNLKYALITAAGDDSLDWTDGWRGNGQFIVIQQRGDEADRGIEADNLDKANDAEPRSNPILYNMTMIGDPDFGDGSSYGMNLRRGTAGNIRNTIVMGFKEDGINIDSIATFEQAEQGNLIVDNNIFWNNNPNFSTDATDPDAASIPFTTAQFMTSNMNNNEEVDPQLGNPYDLDNPDFRPTEGSPATDGSVPVAAPPQGNTFIVATDYIGAVSPDDDWTRKPWTTYGAAETTTTTTVNNTSTTTVPPTTTTVPPTTTTVPPTTTTIPSSGCGVVSVESAFLPLKAGLLPRVRRIVITGEGSNWDRTSAVSIEDIPIVIPLRVQPTQINALIIIPSTLFGRFTPGEKAVGVATGPEVCTGTVDIQ
jgi:hypothetical protein